MDRVVSGIRPTGFLHLGNYFGALTNFIKMQEENDCFFFIADYHSLTTHPTPKDLQANVKNILVEYIAAGLDPEKATIYVQSDVPQVCELSLLLSMNVYVGELQRVASFKEKVRRQPDNVNAGLLTYPVLMAADILLYDTDVVPVGNDQKQHIELTRDIAIRVNNKYGKTFVVPEGRFMKEGARIMALDDPEAKMSKSAENIHSRISLLDEDSKIKKSIMRATTDSDGEFRFDPVNKPGVSNLLNIYSAFSGVSVEEILAGQSWRGYGDLKKELVAVTQEALAPIKKNYEEIRHSEELIRVLNDGAERASAIAAPVMQRVRDKFGLGLG